MGAFFVHSLRSFTTNAPIFSHAACAAFTERKLHHLSRETFSGDLVMDSERSLAEVEVWGVDFVDNSIPENAKNENPATRITIWVANDLTTSTLSVGEWDLAN